MRTVGLLTSFPSPDRPVGGVATYSRHLYEALAQAGLELKVFAQRRPAPSDPAIPAWDFGWSFLRSIDRALSQTPVGIVHIHHEPFIFGEGMAAIEALWLPRLVRRLGLPCVMTLHAVPLISMARQRGVVSRAARGYLRVMGHLQPYVDSFIVHEHEQAMALTRYGRVAARRIAVVPHGISPTQQAAKSSESGPFTLGAFGYLTPYKDYEYLLEEFARLRLRMPEARLMFSLSLHPRRDNPRHRRKYADLMRQAASSAGVSVLGHLTDPELSRFLAACDVVVAPYRYAVSASGIAATALAAGVPVLVPEGFGELGRLDGWSFPFVRNGLSDVAFRASSMLPRMSSRAKAFAADRTWQHVAMRHQEVYDSL